GTDTADRGGNAQDAARAVAKAAPIALIRPVIGATEAVSKTLLGVTNQIDPRQMRDIEDVSLRLHVSFFLSQTMYERCTNMFDNFRNTNRTDQTTLRNEVLHIISYYLMLFCFISSLSIYFYFFNACAW